MGSSPAARIWSQQPAASSEQPSAAVDFECSLSEPRSARKTGLGDTVRTECSLFYLRHRVVACVLTKDNADRRWILDNEPNLTMARMGEAIVAAWPK